MGHPNNHSLLLLLTNASSPDKCFKVAGGTVGGGAVVAGGGGGAAASAGAGAAAAGGTAAATGATGHPENSIMKLCSFKIKENHYQTLNMLKTLDELCCSRAWDASQLPLLSCSHHRLWSLEGDAAQVSSH